MDRVSARTPGFGEVHFGGAELGDKRRTRRLVYTADLLMKHPGGSLPKKLADWADLTGLYRLVRAERVTHAAVIATHCRRTLELAGRHDGVVLLIHDTTELDYTQLPSLADQLGQIGTGGGRGYLCHNTLAVALDSVPGAAGVASDDGDPGGSAGGDAAALGFDLAGAEVLGLASQILHRRRDVPAGETPSQKRDHPDRESRLWLAGCAACPLPADLPAADPGLQNRLWVDVADRGADTFEFLDYSHRAGRRYVVRSARDRCLGGEDHVADDRIHQYLHAYTRDLPTLGERTVEVPRRQAGKRKSYRKPRQARVRIAAGSVTPRVPHFARGQCQSESIDTWVVHVLEQDPPAGEEPLEWLLLTNVPTATLEQACRRIGWYMRRPMIEELHKGMKTGCCVESPQFENAARLEPVIGLLSVVAVALLQLRHLARRKGKDGKSPDTTPATTVVPKLFVRVLAGWRYKQARDDLSAYEFAMALAKLGGHLNRKGDGFPGWLTLWRGWQDLCLMVRGAEAVRCV